MGEQIWTVIALMAGGVFSGAVALFAWERVWLWRRMPIEQFAVDFRRSLVRVDPAIPILLVLSAIGAVGLATQSEGTAMALLLAAIVIQLLIFVGSLALAEPINLQFRRRPEGVVPPDAEALRRRWRHLHLLRSGLALLAFACIVLAVAY